MKQPLGYKKQPNTNTPTAINVPIELVDDGKHYTPVKFYSYSDVFMALIDGGRGIGKTTGWLVQAIKNCRKGEQFIYVRRYKTELKKFVNKHSMKPINSAIGYTGDGTGGYNCVYKGATLGYLIPLVTSRGYKSVDFSKVTLIIFDECFVKPTPGYRYLPDEVIIWLEFLSTVIRTRTNVKVILLGNNEDMFSPYHGYWDIPLFKDIYIDKVHGIFCQHVINSEALLEEEKKTGLFKLVHDKAYADYHYNNEYLGASEVDLMEKPSNASLSFRVLLNGHTVSCYTYYDTDNNLSMYCEHRTKVIKDNKTFNILDKNKVNYLEKDAYTRNTKQWLYWFYWRNRIKYNDKYGANLILWLIENIK